MYRRPASAAKRRNQGFSLLEMMVVLFVIGMMVGLVSITTFNFDPEGELQDYGEDLYEQLRFGSDEALFGGEHIGLVPVLVQNKDEEHWQLVWHRFRDGSWNRMEELEPIEPPSFIELSVEIDDEPVDLYKWLDFEKPLPVIIFYGGGEALAGTIILGLDGDTAANVNDFEKRYAHLDINEIGRVNWRERDEEAAALAAKN